MVGARQDPHAHMHAQTRTRERRLRLANEAARLMAEGGVRDYQQAKRKAAQRLGIFDDASLPRNREIADALRNYQRLFLGESQPLALRQRREAAQRALAFFQAFSPRLVGPVLDGTADAHAPITLHLHCDDPDAIARWLDDHRIPAQSRSRRLRLDRERELDALAWLFDAEGMAFEVTVLPLDGLRQAPLSPIDGRPMARASALQLLTLLANEDIAAHEADQ